MRTAPTYSPAGGNSSGSSMPSSASRGFGRHAVVLLSVADRWCWSGRPTAAIRTVYVSSSPSTRNERSSADDLLGVAVRAMADVATSMTSARRHRRRVPSSTSVMPVGWASTISIRPGAGIRQ